MLSLTLFYKARVRSKSHRVYIDPEPGLPSQFGKCEVLTIRGRATGLWVRLPLPPLLSLSLDVYLPRRTGESTGRFLSGV